MSREITNCPLCGIGEKARRGSSSPFSGLRSPGTPQKDIDAL